MTCLTNIHSKYAYVGIALLLSACQSTSSNLSLRLKDKQALEVQTTRFELARQMSPQALPTNVVGASLGSSNAGNTLIELSSDEDADEIANQVETAEDVKTLDEIDEVGVEARFNNGDFVLCMDSIYMKEWENAFNARWQSENKKKYRHKSKLNAALKNARAQAYLKLVYPAISASDYDYPVSMNRDVISWMQYFQTRGRTAFVTWLRRAEDVVPKMRVVLEEKGLPKDLVYLAMIESGFNNRAYSIAKAAGTWQFIPGTGVKYGLRIDDYVDERRDPSRSTAAAAAYLTDLYVMFGDWHLASAGYNAGEGRIRRSLKRSSNDADFWSLAEEGKLPRETKHYVPKIIAAMLIAKNPTRFGFDVTEGSHAIKYKMLRVQKSIALADLAESIGANVKILEDLNPELRVGITPPRDSYEIRVPETLYASAVASFESIPEAPREQDVATRIGRKQTVKQLADKFKLPLSSLLKANPNLKSSSWLNKGQQITVPVVLGTGQFHRMTADEKPRKTRRAYNRRVALGARKNSKVSD